MAGINPYIERVEQELPKQKYELTFLPMQIKVVVSPDSIKSDFDGLPGSILNAALEAGIDIDHSCGGVCACSTCHIIVKEGFESCNDATEDEEDMLDLAPGLNPKSRLACQCVPDGSQGIIVEVPEWNRNLVSEDH